MSLEQIVRLHHNRLITLQDRAGTIVGTIWDRFGGPSDAELEDFVRHVVPIVAGARLATVKLMAGYLGLVINNALGESPVVRLDITAILASIRNGTPIDEVYTRSVVTMRSALADNKPYVDALAAARARAVSAARMDVAVVNRDAAADGMSSEPRIVGYTRVLSGAACAFCAAASTQRYKSEDLMPLHNNCDCDVAPIIGTRDPGRVVNHQLLANLKEAGGSQYWQGNFTVDENGTIRHPPADGSSEGAPLDVAVREHGELGPVLTDARDAFTGPADIAN